jgi:hypothetical protein
MADPRTYGKMWGVAEAVDVAVAVHGPLSDREYRIAATTARAAVRWAILHRAARLRDYADTAAATIRANPITRIYIAGVMILVLVALACVVLIVSKP